MKLVPLSSQNTIEFTASLLFSQHNLAAESKPWKLRLTYSENRAVNIEVVDYH